MKYSGFYSTRFWMLVIAFCCVASMPAITEAQTPATSVTIIKAGRLLDGRGGAALAPATLEALGLVSV